jgi:hypothetical protein
MTHAADHDWRGVPALTWVGRGMSGLFVLFMLGASVVPKFFLPEVSHPTIEALGWSARYTVPIGVIELVGVILYVIPRTAVLGAVLLMGLLGGAMATQIRVEAPLFSHVLFSLYLGLFMWGGLWLRDVRLRAVFPLRRD